MFARGRLGEMSAVEQARERGSVEVQMRSQNAIRRGLQATSSRSHATRSVTRLDNEKAVHRQVRCTAPKLFQHSGRDSMRHCHTVDIQESTTSGGSAYGCYRASSRSRASCCYRSSSKNRAYGCCRAFETNRAFSTSHACCYRVSSRSHSSSTNRAGYCRSSLNCHPCGYCRWSCHHRSRNSTTT